MKKKLLSLMVIMSLVVSMTLGVTGCGSKSSDSDKKVLKVAFECACTLQLDTGITRGW